MATGEQRHQHLVDHLVLADDDLADLREDPLTPQRHPFCNRRNVRRSGHMFID
jgi:hypothetical protein